MEESHKVDVEKKTLNTKDHLLYDSICVKFTHRHKSLPYGVRSEDCGYLGVGSSVPSRL